MSASAPLKMEYNRGERPLTYVLTRTPCPNAGGRLARFRSFTRRRRPTRTLYLYEFHDPRAASQLAERVDGVIHQGDDADTAFEATRDQLLEEVGGRVY